MIDDKETTENPVQAARELLRNERRSRQQTDRASENLSGNSPDNDLTFGATVQAPGREINNSHGNGSTSQRNHRQNGNIHDSASGQSGRVRRPVGRPRNSDRGAPGNIPQIIPTEPAAGLNIYTEETVERSIEPDRPQGFFDPNRKEETAKTAPKKKGLFDRKEQPKEIQQPTRKKRIFSEKEASEKQDALIAALESHFLSFDQFLWERLKDAGKDTGRQPIWSDTDEEEIAAIAKPLIRLAKRHEVAAVAVDVITESADYMVAITAFAPRLKKTGQILRETQKPRKRRTDRPGAERESA